jgi:alpha-beta hydrolase superfamily lysophospholipase
MARTMKIELISQRPASPTHATPILFVHGAACAAWCWSEHFLPFFAENGYVSYALSLRGHGGSEGRDRLHWASIMDYVQDIAQAVAVMGQEPAFVAQSMGGLVLQHYLGMHTAPAAALMASLPHTGLAWRRAGLMLRHLAMSGLNSLTGEPSQETLRGLFAGELSEERLRHYQGLVQPESLRACLEIAAGRLPRPGWVRTPMLVLAAEDDCLLSPAEMYGLAHAYRADLEVVPNIGHVMMLDVGWERAAERILAWLSRELRSF